MGFIKQAVHFINKNAILILLVLIALTSTFLVWVQRGERNVVFEARPRYHFYFVAPNSVDPFWQEVRQGAEESAKQHGVAIEYNAPRFNNPQEEQRFLDIAVTSGVDGIITHVSSELDFSGLINKSFNKGIPVVTIENDDNKSSRSAFVGTNSFLLGKKTGELMAEATGRKASIAIIVSDGNYQDKASQNLNVTGFLSAIKDYPDMKVVKTYTSKMGSISAEEITQAIINGPEYVNAILTTNSIDTLGTAQLVVDHNKVGSLVLIGYGDAKGILRYIERGVIYGTVMSDPYKMGWESVKALMDIKEKKNASTIIDTGVKTITRSNMAEYAKKANMNEQLEKP